MITIYKCPKCGGIQGAMSDMRYNCKKESCGATGLFQKGGLMRAYVYRRLNNSDGHAANSIIRELKARQARAQGCAYKDPQATLDGGAL